MAKKQPIALNIEQLIGRVEIRFDRDQADTIPEELREKIVREVVEIVTGAVLHGLQLASEPAPEEER